MTKKFVFGCEVICDWKEGSTIVYKEISDGKEIEHVKGVILNIEPGRLLQHTAFGPQSGLEDIESNYTQITYELFSKNGITIINLTQENFGGDEKRYNDSDQGWDYMFSGLKELLEN